MKKKTVGILLIAGAGLSVQAVDTSFTGSGANPSWTNSALWTAGIPTAGDVAYVTNNLTAARTVVISSTVTNGAVYIGTMDGAFARTIGGASGTMIFDNGGNGSHLTMVAPSTNSTVSVANIVLNDNLAITNASTSTLTVSSIVSGNKSISINGVGVVTLKGTNTYSGGTTVNSGTLTVDSGGASASIAQALGTGTVTLNNGARMTVGNFTITNNFTINGSTAIDNNATLTGAISGSGSITHSGGNPNFKLRLDGNNSGFSGNITNNAVLAFGHTNALGTGTLVANDLSSLGCNMTGTNKLSNNIILNGKMNLGAQGSAADFELIGTISGTGSLFAAHALVSTILSSSNSYSGGTTVAFGEIIGNAAGCFGTGAMTVGLAGTNVVGTLTLNGAYLDDLAALILGTNSVLNLNFAGSDTVGSIMIDGTNLVAGTYTSAQLDALGLGTVAGTGSLTVIPEPATVLLFGVGGMGAWLIRRNRMKVNGIREDCEE